MMEACPSETSRPDSPSPSLTTTVASSVDAHMEPAASTAYSFNSSCTSLSLEDNVHDMQFPGKRRGYMRPQATIFADSARNRDSVMSLGTIAHLQHYFARTGLLDGKGGTQANDTKEVKDMARLPKPSYFTNDCARSVSNSYGPDAYATSPTSAAGGLSPIPSSPATSYSSKSLAEPKLLALPPTFSTYKHRTSYVASPPNPSVLRSELREALEDARKVLVEAREESKEREASSGSDSLAAESRPSQGWHEIEGLRILDLVTLAIKAAKNYYTSHENPQRLYSLKSERRIRAQLYEVLEVLKKVGARNFAGGYRDKEIEDILGWISDIEDLVNKDEKAAKEEQEKRESWFWLNGSCNGHEREREWVFLKSFEPKGVHLPPWNELSEGQTRPGEFLLALRDGIKLVQLHNELVKNSWRQFGEIKKWHVDTAKPYRCIENLKYWVKAAQLRWDVMLDLNVAAVVQGKDMAAWRNFDAAVLKWSKAVRERITLEWKEDNRERSKPGSTPTSETDTERASGASSPCPVTPIS